MTSIIYKVNGSCLACLETKCSIRYQVKVLDFTLRLVLAQAISWPISYK